MRILGTSPDSIDLAEDRERFAKLLWDLGIPQAASGTATSPEEAREVAGEIGFPVVVRPSYVLGGRAMAIVYDTAALDRYMRHAVQASPEHPILIDKFLEDATEIDVDALADASGAVVIGGIMEHIEQAGIHSGDSSCVVPPFQLSERAHRDDSRLHPPHRRALNVIGLMNTQFAIKDDVVYVLEVNPRASRTVPYLSKATGMPLAKVAAKLMIGRTLAEQGLTEDLEVSGFVRQDAGVPVRAVPGRRHAARPGDEVDRRGHGRRRDVRHRRSPRRRWAPGSTCRRAARRSSASTTATRPPSCRSRASWRGSGFKLVATRGTAAYLRAHGLDVDIVFKINEGRPHVGDELLNRRIALVINTPLGRESFFDDRAVRSVAMLQGVPAITTLTGAAAAVSAIAALATEGLTVKSLQEYHAVPRV